MTTAITIATTSYDSGLNYWNENSPGYDILDRKSG